MLGSTWINQVQCSVIVPKVGIRQRTLHRTQSRALATLDGEGQECLPGEGESES